MEWINKSKTRNGNFKGQVVIKLTRDEKAFSIRFMKSSYKKITNNNYIVCGLEQSRLYFKQEDPKLGYKLVPLGKNWSYGVAAIIFAVLQ